MDTTHAAVQVRGKRSGWSVARRRRFVTGMLFISPWIIGFFLFTLYPMLASLYYSFTEFHIHKTPQWIGFGNYIELFGDKLFWTSLGNTMYLVVIGVPLTLLLSFICAVLLNFKVRGQSIYRVIFFMPSIVPTVATALLWIWILNPSSGIVNTLLAQFGIVGPNWFRDPNWSKPALIMMGLWGMGGTIVIYLSGLQDVPASLLEAAEIDGATWFQRLWHITIPMVSPITLFNLIIGVIGTFQYFAQAYVFGTAVDTSTIALGAPLNSTLFYSVYLYQNGFIYLRMGYASAMAWILFIIIMICTLLLLRTSDRWTYYAG
ncbi:MAG TPA: sugar ABC transporter permease [Phototrophicaceae bacterium]|nr:sugar ABC transporter permease [Phototrophicaceae bacterium]